MNQKTPILRAWYIRDLSKTDEENIRRMANAFNVSEDEVKRIVNGTT